MSHVLLNLGIRSQTTRSVSRKPFLLSQETVFFVLASLLDLGMTIYLITHPGSIFYESNPIASWVLMNWGIRGMAVFKLSLVSFVCLIGCIIAAQRHDVAVKMMATATAIVSCVVTYSALLYIGFSGPAQLIADLG